MANKKILSLVVSILLLILAACSGSPATQSAQTTSTVSSSTSVVSSSTPADPASAETQTNATITGENLALGILGLEAANQPLTSSQAVELLPLWQQVQSLISDTSATADQLQAVYSEIQGVLTADQVTAIQAMNYNQGDLLTLLTQLGIAVTPDSNFNSGGPNQMAGTPGANSNRPDKQGTPFASGGTDQPGRQGTPPASGGRALDGTSTGPGQMPQSSGINPTIVNALIQYLQSKGG